MILRIILSFGLVMCTLLGSAQSTPYSFFLAGHVYGEPGTDSDGVFAPFKERFPVIQNTPNMEFGIFLGDIGGFSPEESDWLEVDRDVEELGFPVYYVVGNHDLYLPDFYHERYGPWNYSFRREQDLFFAFDGYEHKWSIREEQLSLLKDTIAKYSGSSRNIFINIHQLIWWTTDEEDPLNEHVPNSFDGFEDPTNFKSELLPYLQSLPNQVYVFAGDIGSAWKSHFMYEKFDNVTLLATGMGDHILDQFVLAHVDETGSIGFEIICLANENPHCMGTVEEWSTTEIAHQDRNPMEFKLFPNPITDWVQISWKGKEQIRIQIINALGCRVAYENLNGQDHVNMDLSHLPPGLYHLHAENQNGSYFQTLNIQ